MTFSPRYRALVYASLFASFLVVVWGGIVRVTGSGLGCPDWPLCHGQFLPSLDPATRIEWTHRFLAIAAGLTVAAMVAWTSGAYPSERRGPVLGGAWVRGAEGTAGCPAWPLCGAIPDRPVGYRPVFVPRIALPSTGAPAIAMLHRYIAAIVGVLVIAACVEAWRHRRDAPGLGPLGIATAAIFLAQVAIGAANPLTRFSPLALGAHPAVASLLWCSVVGLTAVAWRPVSRQGALVRDLIALTKPAIMSLLLLTALGGMFLAAH